MRVQPGCHGCIQRQIKLLAHQIGRDDEHRRQILDEFSIRTRELAASASPPELAAMYYAVFERETGIRDPFQKEKSRSTELALLMLPELEKLVGTGDGAFERALLLAIGGNIIDYGVNPEFDLSSAEHRIRQVLDFPYDRNSATDLNRRMNEARSILYILDNCGEAVIDRLMIEPYREKITVGVRGKPILNDVTRDDAIASGLDFVPLVDTGDSTPGVSLRRSSPEFLSALRSADLVIAKGQGNFESMGDEFRERPAYYLLRTKCEVMCRQLGAELNSIQIIGRNLD